MGQANNPNSTRKSSTTRTRHHPRCEHGFRTSIPTTHLGMYHLRHRQPRRHRRVYLLSKSGVAHSQRTPTSWRHRTRSHPVPPSPPHQQRRIRCPRWNAPCRSEISPSPLTTALLGLRTTSHTFLVREFRQNAFLPPKPEPSLRSASPSSRIIDSLGCASISLSRIDNQDLPSVLHSKTRPSNHGGGLHHPGALGPLPCSVAPAALPDRNGNVP